MTAMTKTTSMDDDDDDDERLRSIKSSNGLETDTSRAPDVGMFLFLFYFILY